MTTLHNVGVLGHPLRPSTSPLAEQIAASLAAHGVAVWTRTGDAVDQMHDVVPGTDLVVAIGGDGAMLRAARICAPHGVPVLGVNVGRVGFLTEVPDAAKWPDVVDAVVAGDYWIEERMMLAYEVRRDGELICHGDALNDVVIGRGPVGGMVWLETFIDGTWATTYAADALIVATPTGSTAYALAVGGPILPPELRNILLLPVAPYLSMDRPMVVSRGAVIDISISPETRADTALAVDGALAAELQVDDHLFVEASRHVSRFVRLRERTYFYRSLLDRLEPRHPARREPRRRTPPGRTPSQLPPQAGEAHDREL